MNDQNQQAQNINPTPQPINVAPEPQKSNTGKIVLIVLLVIFVPIILLVGAVIFFSAIIFSSISSTDLSDVDLDLDVDEPEISVYNDVNATVAGTWDCYPFDGRGADKSDGFDSTLKLTRFGEFVYGEYGNEDNNHYKGTFEAIDLKKTNGNGAYRYYSLDFTSNEFSLDGVTKSGADAALSDAEIGITNGVEGREFIMAFESTGNMYYCYERK